jgi:hypothetical protein
MSCLSSHLLVKDDDDVSASADNVKGIIKNPATMLRLKKLMREQDKRINIDAATINERIARRLHAYKAAKLDIPDTMVARSLAASLVYAVRDFNSLPVQARSEDAVTAINRLRAQIIQKATSRVDMAFAWRSVFTTKPKAQTVRVPHLTGIIDSLLILGSHIKYVVFPLPRTGSICIPHLSVLFLFSV